MVSLNGRKTLPSSLIAQSAIYVGGAVLNALVPFLLLPVLARALGPADYGVVGSLTALIVVVGVLAGLSTHGLLSVVYFKSDAVRFGRQITACLIVLLGTAPALSIAVPMFGSAIERVSGIDPRWQWTIVVAASGQFLLSTVLAVSQIRGEALRYIGLQFANISLSVTLTLLLVLGLDWGWEGRAAAHALVAVGIGLLGVTLLTRDRTIVWRCSMADIAAALRFGLPLVPHALAAAVMGSVDRLVITNFGGETEAGHYFAAFQVASLLPFLCNAVNQAWAPWLFKSLADDSYERRRLIVQTTYVILAGILAGGLCLAIIGAWATQLLAGPAFALQPGLMAFLAGAAACNGAYYFFTNYIFHARRTELLSILTVSIAGLQVLGSVFLTQRFGATGAALSAFVASGLYLVGVVLLAQRLVPMPWRLGRNNLSARG